MASALGWKLEGNGGGDGWRAGLGLARRRAAAAEAAGERARRRVLRAETGRGLSGGRGGSAGPAPARAPGTKAPARRWRGPPPAARRACAPRPPDRPRAGARGRLAAGARAPLAVNQPVSPSRRASSRCPDRPRHARQPRAGPSVSRTRTGGRPAHCPAQAQPQPFPQPGSPRGGREKRRGCRAPPGPPAKPGYLGGLPGGGSQPGQARPPHTRGGGSGGGGGGGGSSERLLRGGAGAEQPADWPAGSDGQQACPAPPFRLRRAGPQAAPATARPLSVHPLRPVWPSTDPSFGEAPRPKRPL
ncbi:collagen alpha-1(I) chain-like [Ursus maritimus]|uniref:Collagen alpha-1(I) chain-like n=1 Tax=Ursus maritimus TaxID=29073 RepID=A0A8M1GI56_URSMA|nr:collagen alpha-1(I) chain-like [Ursus maritimus]